MKLSLHLTAILGLVFFAIFLGVAINGFVSLRGVADPAQLADAKGYAWFWTFLAGVVGTIALLAWRMARMNRESEDATGG